MTYPKISASILFIATSVLPATLSAQRQELGLTIGGITPSDRISTNSSRFSLHSGTALQADYEHRVLAAGQMSLYLGVHLLASPQRKISSSNGDLTRDIASLYITPALMLKLFPRRRVNPWVNVGGGYGDYEQSSTVLNGSPNGAPRELARGVLMYGAGLDFPFFHFLALRGEIRDFYTGNAAYNLPVAGGQHNISAGGGIVIRFGRR